jgi:hypothetical protein
MAYPTLVDAKTTNTVTSANVATLGAAPAVAMGLLQSATAKALADAAANAANAQQQANQLAQQVTKSGMDLISAIVKNVLQQEKTG